MKKELSPASGGHITSCKRLASGTRIGRWTVLELPEAEAAQRISSRKWLCRCDCGTERLVLERALLYGGSESCGCLRKEKALAAVSHDLTGQIFGELTVLGKAEHQPKNGGVWWHCRCSCGNTYDISATLLSTGKRTHCPDRSHERNYNFIDIAGQKFERLTALYATDKRDSKGSLVWHCRCDCGNEVDVSYNSLMYTHVQSCGCKKKEHDQELGSLLTHVAGTSMDMLKSKKIPTNNTTGTKGVYFIRGKYVAKIVLQKKAYYLGTYDNIDDAIEARRKGEELLHTGTAEYYERWKKLADADPDWAAENPISIRVERDSYGELKVWFEPDV